MTGLHPISQVARVHYEFEEPILWRRNRDVVLTVRSDIAPGVQAPDVTAAIQPAIDAILATGATERVYRAAVAANPNRRERIGFGEYLA